MHVQAISNVSSTPKFEGGMKKTANNQTQSYPQMDAPMSRDAAKALESTISFGNRSRKNRMRNATMGVLMSTAALGGLASCDKPLVESESWSTSGSKANAWAYATCCDCGPIVDKDTIYITDTINNTVRDTIIKTVIDPVIINSYPEELNDSVIHQGLNIGGELEGPAPAPNVIMVGARYYNEYDYKLYEAKLDSVNTNSEQLSYITKVTDMYDPENPKTYYMKSLLTDDPGVGIKFTRYIIPERKITGADKNKYPKGNDPRWQYMEYEVRTNLRDGKKNIGHKYDRNSYLPDGELVEYLRGLNPGEVLFGRYLYDENGNPYIGEDGKQEKAYYDFSGVKMWSAEVHRIDKNQYTK